MRLALLAIVLSGCPLGRVPEHTHSTAELGLSCSETCAPGLCDSSYDVAAGQEIPCEAEASRYALCICRAPVAE